MHRLLDHLQCQLLNLAQCISSADPCLSVLLLLLLLLLQLRPAGTVDGNISFFALIAACVIG
jgi:hypothetical protein